MRSQGPHFLRGGDVRFGSWLCENSERAFTEGNRVLPAPRFPCCLVTARDDIGAGEEGHSMRSACPSVLTRPRPKAALAKSDPLRCSKSKRQTHAQRRAAIVRRRRSRRFGSFEMGGHKLQR